MKITITTRLHERWAGIPDLRFIASFKERLNKAPSEEVAFGATREEALKALTARLLERLRDPEEQTHTIDLSEEFKKVEDLKR